MKELRGLAGLLLLVAVVLVGAWFLLRGGEAANTNTVAVGDDLIAPANDAPLEMPKPGLTGSDGTPASDASETFEEAEPEPAAVLPPDLHVPDYGTAIQRGGAVAEFELYDLNGVRVPASACHVALWRRVGNHWIEEEARIDHRENVVRCDGLKGLDEYAGLEPGDYELELQSQAWGNFRHEFHVGRDERKRDRLTTPNWQQLVRFRFTHPDGTPVSHLPAIPQNQYTSDPLESKPYTAASCVALRDPPRMGLGIGGGGTFRSARPYRGVRRKPDVLPLYPTNDGCWWITVQAGANNTVSFKLEESLWGQASYTLSDKFMTVREVAVTLRTPADFTARLAEYGREVEGYPAGNDPALRVVVEKPAREKFDPYMSELKPGKTRVILDVEPTEGLSVQISANGRDMQTCFWSPGDVYCYDFDSDKAYWYRFVCGPLYSTEWRALDTAGGGTRTVSDSLAADRVRIDTVGLSPTLRAFALTIDLQLSVVEPAEDPPEVVDEDPSDKPNADLAENPNEVEVTDEPFVYRGKRPDTRNAAPKGASGYINLPLRPGNQHTFDGLVGGPRVSQPDIDGRLRVRTHLRGAAHYSLAGRHTTFTFGPDGRSRFDALILNGEWQNHQTDGQDLKTVLKSGAIRPSVCNVLVARAVGPQTEGLPWVQGLLVDYEDDEVAQQVREIASHWKTYRPLQVADYDAYQKLLAELDQETDPESRQKKLREVIGDELYDSFETDEQRNWYARKGAWYDTYRKVYSDDHGYFAIENPKLTPGKCYVMYLWSNSKDEFNPDARIVFQVDENGVADLGAIHLPAYLD